MGYERVLVYYVVCFFEGASLSIDFQNTADELCTLYVEVSSFLCKLFTKPLQEV
jgi:hypothetical protein